MPVGAVAEGNLSPRPIVATSDELGTLTQSFNTMTMQLSDAREAVERNRRALEDAKAYLESVLANMSAGVMVLDNQLLLVTFNASAEQILQQDLRSWLKRPFASIDGLQNFSEPIIRAFSEQNAQSAMSQAEPREQHWQQQIEIPRSVGDAEVEAHPLLPVDRLAAGHLPQAGDPGPDAQPPGRVVGVPRDLLGQRRPRPDEGHVPAAARRRGVVTTSFTVAAIFVGLPGGINGVALALRRRPIVLTNVATVVAEAPAEVRFLNVTVT